MVSEELVYVLFLPSPTKRLIRIRLGFLIAEGRYRYV